jgi:hypothetical protein
LRKDEWAASAVLGNTDAHSKFAVAAVVAATEATAAAAAGVMSIRQSLVGEEGMVGWVFGWLR